MCSYLFIFTKIHTGTASRTTNKQYLCVEFNIPVYQSIQGKTMHDIENKEDIKLLVDNFVTVRYI